MGEVAIVALQSALASDPVSLMTNCWCGYNRRPSMAVWLRKCASFEEDRQADREFWAAFTPDARVALVEQIRQDWTRISGQPLERLRRTVRVLEREAR
jgi:hypothetical protein